MVEDLLRYIYREYEMFCVMTNKMGKFPLQLKKIEICCGNTGERSTSENINMNINEAKDGGFAGNNSYNSSNGAFYGNEVQYRHGMPNSSFDPEIFYKQFGQEGIANCFNGMKNQQSSNHGKENVPVFMTHNWERRRRV